MSSAERFAEVAIPVPLRRTFTYRIPESLALEVQPGRQVTVPFGRRKAEGFVVSLPAEADVKGIKDIQAVDGQGPLFTEELLELTRWISTYYLSSWGEVLRTALPGGVEPTSVRRRRAAADSKKPGDSTAAAGNTVEEPAVPAEHQLTPEQEAARREIVAAMDAGRHQTFLLNGITGSGKTEVYLRAAAHAESLGGQSLILVPEISLSPQMVRHFKGKFGERVVVWHSSLPLGLRKEAWRRVRDGRAGIVVGARSAVFAPFSNLKLVVVDEEHEPAYKQDDAPRYHGRDVAVYRGFLAGAPVVLGSATPSLESFHNATTGKYTLLELPRRIEDRPRPTVELVPLLRSRDRRPEDEPEAPRRSFVLADPLIDGLRAAVVERGEQAILFLNRRGHSTMVHCRECSYVARCPHCDIALTWHADRNDLCCHYCAYRLRDFNVCPDCGGACFVYKGVGTQKVESELARLIPEARLLRMDFDSTRRRGSLEKIVDDFRERRADILLGTQMVARGLDFPAVTLVGVINADTQLNLPDFRSAERTFQLLTQVAGRAGRGDRPGHVLVQTFSPGHYAIQSAQTHDFPGFFAREMEFRREVQYPPLARMVNLLFDGKEEAKVIERAEEIGRYLEARVRVSKAGVDLLGPAPQSLSRLKGKYRWHLTLKGNDHRVLRGLAEEAMERPAVAGVRLTADVDPASLL